MVASGGANFFRHPEWRTALRLTAHKLYNVQLAGRVMEKFKHARGGVTVGPLRDSGWCQTPDMPLVSNYVDGLEVCGTNGDREAAIHRDLVKERTAAPRITKEYREMLVRSPKLVLPRPK